MRGRLRLALSIALALLVAAASSTPLLYEVHASQTETPPAGAYAAVEQAFSQVYAVSEKGGNVSALVSQLNQALTYLAEAESVNSTNPGLASTLSSEAYALARNVSAEAGVAAQRAQSAHLRLVEGSVAGASASVAAGLAFYFYSEKVYRRLWLHVYREFRVKRSG